MSKQNQDLEEARRDFAKKLQEEFIKKNIDIDSLSELTKIRVDFLQALTSGDFAKLPGEVFGMGFVKSICKSLQIPADELVVLYKKSWEIQTDNLTVLKSGPDKATHKGEILVGDFAKKSKIAQKIIGIFLFLAIGYGIIWWIAHTDNELADIPAEKQVIEKVEEKKVEVAPENKPAEVVAPQPESVKAEQVPVASTPPPPPSPVEVAKPAEEVKPTETVVPTVGGTELKIVVKNTVKIKHRIDTKEYATTDFQPQTYTYQIKEFADLLIYDASAVEITYGNRGLGPLGGKDRVRRIRFVK